MVEGWIAAAAAHGCSGETAEKYREACSTRFDHILQLWLDDDGTPVGCLLLELPAGEPMVWVACVGGDLDIRRNAESILKELCVIAKITRRTKIAGHGRKGWGRMLKNFGFVSEGDGLFSGRLTNG